MGGSMKYLDTFLAETPQESRSSAAIAFWAAIDHIALTAPTVAEKIIAELTHQRSYLKMIASENYSSLAVQLAMGNLLTDKYAEGIPTHRFYAGCDNVDAIETEAAALVREIFGAEHAYVQPHSGADANLVAYWAILTKRIQSREVERLGKKNLDELSPAEYEHVRQMLVNQKVLGMSLNSGGHLTHGYRHNISSKMMHAAFYDVDPKTELIDYDVIFRRAKEERPLILLAGYSAYPRRINFAKMKEIAASVGATFMVDMAHFAGLVAGGVFQDDYNPIPFADIVTSTTHKTLRGPRGGIIICKSEYREFVDKGCPLVLGGPLPHVMAAKCVAFHEARSDSFSDYAAKIVKNAQALAEGLTKRGARLTTGGTENHMVILDVSPYNLTGRHAETALRGSFITCNRNAIPYDKNGPWYTSGVRLGTAALTTLGLGEHEMDLIAGFIDEILRHTTPAALPEGGFSRSQSIVPVTVSDRMKIAVGEMLSQFPLYPELGGCKLPRVSAYSNKCVGNID
jgi:glycine hydroxymethyltransferase